MGSLRATWRARNALLGRTAPSPIGTHASPRLAVLVDELAERLGSPQRVDDDVVHERRDGRVQVIGIDATRRSRSDVRQRVLRVAHEMHLAHIDADRRRVLAVVLRDGDDSDALRAWVDALAGESGDGKRAESDWRAARRQITLLVVGPQGEQHVRGGDHEIERAAQALATPARSKRSPAA